MSQKLVKSLVKIQYQIQITKIFTKICENVGENSIENECGLLPHVYIIIQVPVLKDGDFVLTESVAMLRYLAREKQVRFVLAKYYWSAWSTWSTFHYTIQPPCERNTG